MTNVSIYMARTEKIDTRLAEAVLDAERLARVRDMKNAETRAESAAAGVALDAALRDFLTDYAPPPVISRDEQGKPRVEGAYISIAHTRGAAICAVSDAEIGADIEITKREITQRVKSRFFSPADAGSDIEIWTAKEAYLKLTGEGLSGGMENLTARNGKITDNRNGKSAFVKHIIAETYTIAAACERDFTVNVIDLSDCPSARKQ